MTTENQSSAENAATDGTPHNSLDAIWVRVQGRMRREFGDATYNSWLKPLELANVDSGRLLVSVPTRFMRDWVQSHYADRICNLCRVEGLDVQALEVHVRAQDARAMLRGEPQKPADSSAFAEDAPRLSAEEAQVPVPAQVRADGDLVSVEDPRFTFDNFVVGKSNELAHAAARRLANAKGVPFNPLFLYGGVGLGKTHLMHAIANHIRQQDPSRKVLYLSAEKFMYQFIRALRYKDTMAFKQQFRSVDVLMIDDVQFIAHKNSTQEEFFHTFNALVDNQRQVVISADRSPSDLEGIEERIKSRLGWGLVADIHPTDYELRLGILQAKADHSGFDAVPAEVLEFLARKITSNVRELEGALNRVLAYGELVGRPITLEMTREVLQDLIRANDRRVTISDIQRVTAEFFNIRLGDLLSARRARAVARPRQVAMYLAKQMTTRSLPEIGRKFGGRDHTTVMHAVKRIEELREMDAAMNEDIERLKRMLEA